MELGDEDEAQELDALAEELAAYDEALAAGRIPEPEPDDSSLPPAWQSRLAGMRQVLARLEADRRQADPCPEVDSGTEAEAALPGPGLKELGRFQIEGELGRGGCGVVFRAWDPRLRRRVALKVPHAGALFDPELRRRFLREGRAAAGLDHPGIVPVYEADEAGAVCYIASAYCPGVNLRDWLRQQAQPVANRDAAALVAALAEAVHYMHERGVLHRDLKPANILLSVDSRQHTVDSRKGGTEAALTPLLSTDYCLLSTPKITDFGLAKVLQEDTSRAAQTRSGAVIGTPAYMAPEQAQGRHADVGPATNVYALGVILYELLTGRVPFVGEADFEVFRQVIGEEPVRPSVLRPTVHRDLETICLACLRKDPRRRYTSAGELALDLRRYLNGEPIKARPMPAWERAWRRVGRSRVASSLAVLVGVIVAGLATGSFWYLRVRDAGELERRRFVYLQQMSEANRAWQNQEYAGLADLLDGLRPPPGKPDLRGFEWSCLWSLYRQDGLRRAQFLNCDKLAFAPDGQTLAAVTKADVQLLDPATLRCRITVQGLGDRARCLAFSPDSQTLATGSVAHAVRLWDVQTGELRRTLAGHTGSVGSVAFSPDGQTLASGDDEHTLLLWDVVTERVRARCEVRGKEIHALAFHPSGKTLVSYSTSPPPATDGEMRLWDTHTGRAERVIAAPDRDQSNRRVAFSPDGRLLASLLGDVDRVRLWDTATWSVLATLAEPGNGVSAIAFSPDGGTLAVSKERAKEIGRVHLWDVRNLLDAATKTQSNASGFAVALASAQEDMASGLATDVSGNSYVSGRFTHRLEQDQSRHPLGVGSRGTAVGLVAKYTPAGTLAWARGLGRAGTGQANAVTVDPAGQVFLTGSFQGSAVFGAGVHAVTLTHPGPQSTFVLKLSAEGDVVWARGLGGKGQARGNALAVDIAGDVYVTGAFQGTVDLDAGPTVRPVASRQGSDDVFIAKLNGRDGSLAWARTVGGPRQDEGRGIAVDAQGGVYVAGTFHKGADFDGAPGSPVLESAGESDAFVLKLDRGGRLVWARALGGPARDQGRAVAVDAGGNVFVTGAFEGAASFGRPATGGSCRSAGLADAFLAKLHPDGRLLWVRGLGGSGQDVGTSLCVDKHGAVYLGGHFEQQVRFNPDSALEPLAGRGKADGFVTKLDPDGEVVWIHGLGGPGEDSVSAVAVDPSGQVHAAGTFEASADFDCGSRTVRLTSVGGGSLFLCRLVPPPCHIWAKLEHGRAWIPGLAFAPQGLSLAVGGSTPGMGAVLRLWHPRRKPLQMGHYPEEVWAVAFSPDGRRLVSGGDTETDPNGLRVWDVGTGRAIWTSTRHRELVSCVAYSPDGRLIASGSYDKTVRLWYAESGTERAVLTGHTKPVRCVGFSPDGGTVATGDEDQVIRLWDVPSGRQRHTLSGLGDMVRGVAFAPDGGTLASVSGHGKICLWEASTGQLLDTITDSSGAYCVAFGPEGRRLAWACPDGRVRVCELAGRQWRAFLSGHAGEVRAVAFTPDGQSIASAGTDGTVRLWDPESGTELLTLRGHTAAVNGISFTHDGKLLASASHDGTIKLWPAERDE